MSTTRDKKFVFKVPDYYMTNTTGLTTNETLWAHHWIQNYVGVGKTNSSKEQDPC